MQRSWIAVAISLVLVGIAAAQPTGQSYDSYMSDQIQSFIERARQSTGLDREVTDSGWDLEREAQRWAQTPAERDQLARLREALVRLTLPTGGAQSPQGHAVRPPPANIIEGMQAWLTPQQQEGFQRNIHDRVQAWMDKVQGQACPSPEVREEGWALQAALSGLLDMLGDNAFSTPAVWNELQDLREALGRSWRLCHPDPNAPLPTPPPLTGPFTPPMIDIWEDIVPRRPTPLELAVYEEINSLRRAPPAYAARLRGSGADYRAAVAEFNRLAPLRPLTLNPQLTAAAQLHANDIARRDVTSHTGATGLSLLMRIQERGLYSMSVAEVISQQQATAQAIVSQLVIDAGVPGAPHRHDLVNARFALVGVACQAAASRTLRCVIDLSVPPMRTVMMPPPPPLEVAPPR